MVRLSWLQILSSYELVRYTESRSLKDCSAACRLKPRQKPKSPLIAAYSWWQRWLIRRTSDANLAEHKESAHVSKQFLTVSEQRQHLIGGFAQLCLLMECRLFMLGQHPLINDHKLKF